MSSHHDEPSRPVDSEESLLVEERELAEAFRAIRDRYHGEHEAADTTLQRALFQTRVQRRRQRFTRWIVLPAAAVLVASTAWAGVTGRLPAVRTMLESIYDGPPREAPPPEHGTPAAHARPAESSSEGTTAAAPPAETTEAAPVATSDPPPAAPEAPVQATPPHASVPVAAAPPARRSEVVGSTPATSSSTASVATSPAIPPPAAAASSDPYAPLFAEAHRIHFTERDPARALAAWDRYLHAAPSGRFAPEARYNRALALVRLGRKTEAQQELAVFANGIYGEYRRADAKALLDALARDGGG